MRSKTSKPNPKPQPSPWKLAPSCSEAGLAAIAAELARELGPRDRVILEGEMGAGKSTFARALLLALGIDQPPEGSPTFAIAHEYRSKRGEAVHIDLYRLRSEEELDDAGIPQYFWGREAVVMVEWLSMFPGFEAKVKEGHESSATWVVALEPAGEGHRRIRIEKLS